MIVNCPGTGYVTAHFCDHLNLRDSGNAGKGLSPEAQGRQMGQIVRVRDLAGCMPHKSTCDLVFLDAAAVVRDADHGDSPVPDLDSNGRRACVDGIFHQLLDDIQRSFNDLSRRNAADGFLCEEFYFHSLVL